MKLNEDIYAVVTPDGFIAGDGGGLILTSDKELAETDAADSRIANLNGGNVRAVKVRIVPVESSAVQPTPDAGEKSESPTRPFVDSFADAMESKLEKNRHKGDREGWLKDTPRALFERLKQEVDELHAALADGTDVESVLSEAADVANFAMMIADSYRNRSPLRAAGGGGER